MSTSAFSTRIWGIDAGRLPQTGPALRFLKIETHGELFPVPVRFPYGSRTFPYVPVRSRMLGGGAGGFPAPPAAWLRAFPPVTTAVTTRLDKGRCVDRVDKAIRGKMRSSQHVACQKVDGCRG